MSQAHDWSWLEEGLVEPEITLDMYLTLPEHLSRKIEVEDGRIIVCAHRDRDIFAVSTADPFPITVSWEQLDRGFPPF
ncbi:MAG: hypothetical protein JWM19_7901 [Actinomycetia bacterium]|nr:hypothetical protein [Actinomycetes bacterium]